MLFALYRIVVFVSYALAFPLLGALALFGSVKWRNRLGRGFADDVCNRSTDVQKVSQLLWAHAASAGEARGLALFVRAYAQRNPDSRFIVTVMTQSGHEAACETLTELVSSGAVMVRFLPLDCPQAIRKALKSINPDLFAFSETEIWPNWTTALTDRKIPYVLLNARLTERSLKGYLRAHSFVKQTMSNYELVICQDPKHLERFRTLGVAPERLSVSGNLKVDAPMSAISLERKRELRKRLGAAETDFLLVCGSIRSGEFVSALKVYQRLAEKYPQLRLALAPRHLERCADILNETRRLGIDAKIFSEEEKPEKARAVTIVDVFGILRELYGAANLAFVGGTMIPIGGHNILEPPQVGTPVLFGPHTENVTDAVALTLQRKCGLQVADWSDFATQMERVLQGELRFEKWDAPPNDSAATESTGPLRFTIDKIENLLAGLKKS